MLYYTMLKTKPPGPPTPGNKYPLTYKINLKPNTLTEPPSTTNNLYITDNIFNLLVEDTS